MPVAEFELIQRYFTAIGPRQPDVALGVGDDAALIKTHLGEATMVATASLIADQDFAAADAPQSVAHRVLALALSRLAAVGAEAIGFTLALTLPQANEAWLDPFSRGLAALAGRHGAELIGGDTTRGPLTVTVHALGRLPAGSALAPGGARAGDLIYVTGTLGDAGLAILARTREIVLRTEQRAAVEHRLAFPEPRLALGTCLRGIASAAVDLPDGLARGLGQLLESGAVGATILADALPVSATVSALMERAGGAALPLNAGGDLELCFTLPPARQGDLEACCSAADCTWIGHVEARRGLRCLLADGTDIAPTPTAG